MMGEDAVGTWATDLVFFSSRRRRTRWNCDWSSDVCSSDLNPIGAIASAAMLLRYGLQLPEAADAVDQAIRAVLSAGARTRDLAAAGEPVLSTSEMGSRIADLVLSNCGLAIADCGLDLPSSNRQSAIRNPQSGTAP